MCLANICKIYKVALELKSLGTPALELYINTGYIYNSKDLNF